MSGQDKLDIYEVLDRFNEEFGYRGLDNKEENSDKSKPTDKRDDVITRQSFNNYLRDYNKHHPRKIQGMKYGRHKKWFKSDIEKLIRDDVVQKNLRDAYLRNTVEVFNGFDKKNIPLTTRVSRNYIETLSEPHRQSLDESIEMAINQLTDKIIEDHFSVFYGNNKLDSKSYLNKEKIIESFIDKSKLEEEAFREVDNYYGIPEYDETGDIIATHHVEERPSTDHFLKDV